MKIRTHDDAVDEHLLEVGIENQMPEHALSHAVARPTKN
jgi:hypothetical protein